MQWKMRPISRLVKNDPWESALKSTQKHATGSTLDLVWDRVTQPMEDFDGHITWPLWENMT